MQVWRSILDGLEGGEETARRAGRWKRDHEWSLNRQRAVQILADGIREHLDEWLDYAWASPGEDYIKKKALEDKKGQDMLSPQDAAAEPWLTPAQSPQPLADEVEEEGLPLR